MHSIGDTVIIKQCNLITINNIKRKRDEHV